MTPAKALRAIAALESGTAAFVGREDVHVYCHNPMKLVRMPNGRECWKRFQEHATYMVLCPDAGMEDLRWVTAAEAASLVVAALSMADTVAA